LHASLQLTWALANAIDALRPMLLKDRPMRIAILGGGHGSYAAAADLTEAGHEVRFWRRDAGALAALQEAGSIRLKDADGARDVPIALATADIGAALSGAALLVVPRPAMLPAP